MQYRVRDVKYSSQCWFWFYSWFCFLLSSWIRSISLLFPCLVAVSSNTFAASAFVILFGLLPGRPFVALQLSGASFSLLLAFGVLRGEDPVIVGRIF